MTYISELRPPHKGIIKRINGPAALKRRLLDMGIIAGSVFEVIKLAPLGDPIDIKVKGYHLSLRKDEAQHIEIKDIEK